MRGLVAAVVTVAGLLSRDVASEPRICNGCARTFTRLTPAQAAQIRATRLPLCRRRGCDGRLWLARGEAIDHLITDLRKNGAPGVEPGTPPNKAAPVQRSTAMTRSIPRRAHDVHAGDIITRDPDHDRPVRWRVTRPAEVTADGVAIIDYVDLPSASAGIAYFGGLVELTVEPVGGAA